MKREYSKSTPGYSVDPPDYDEYSKYRKEYDEYSARSLLCDEMVRLNEKKINEIQVKLVDATGEERERLTNNMEVLLEFKYDWAKSMQAYDAKKDEAWERKREALLKKPKT